MKKLIAFFITASLLCLPIYGYAEVARNASGLVVSHTRSNYSNLAVTGLDKTGNPGYLVLTGVAVSDASYVPEYYIWVDAEGDLVMASAPTIANCSDYPNGDWNSTCILGHDVKVGGQT